MTLHDHSLLFSANSVQSFPSFQDLNRVFGVDIAGAAPDCCCRYNVPKEKSAVSFCSYIEMPCTVGCLRLY